QTYYRNSFRFAWLLSDSVAISRYLKELKGQSAHAFEIMIQVTCALADKPKEVPFVYIDRGDDDNQLEAVEYVEELINKLLCLRIESEAYEAHTKWNRSFLSMDDKEAKEWVTHVKLDGSCKLIASVQTLIPESVKQIE
ncbi:hypothetical protein C5167_011859, partial [Papaver somniferum]